MALTVVLRTRPPLGIVDGSHEWKTLRYVNP